MFSGKKLMRWGGNEQGRGEDGRGVWPNGRKEELDWAREGGRESLVFLLYSFHLFTQLQFF